MVQLYAALLNDYLSEVGSIYLCCMNVQITGDGMLWAGLKSPAQRLPVGGRVQHSRLLQCDGVGRSDGSLCGAAA